MIEQWLAVVDYEGLYEVSDHGRVQSLDRLITRPSQWGGIDTCLLRGKMLRLTPNSVSGLLYVSLSRGGAVQKRTVHTLELEAFVGPRPPGMEGCHWNDIAADNRLSNLRWDTPGSNMRDQVRNGRHCNANKTHCPNEHKYTTENTYIYPNGRRDCITCRRKSQRDYKSRIAERV